MCLLCIPSCSISKTKIIWNNSNLNGNVRLREAFTSSELCKLYRFESLHWVTLKQGENSVACGNSTILTYPTARVRISRYVHKRQTQGPKKHVNVKRQIILAEYSQSISHVKANYFQSHLPICFENRRFMKHLYSFRQDCSLEANLYLTGRYKRVIELHV